MQRAGGDPHITLGLPPEVPRTLADDLLLSVAQVHHIREYYIVLGQGVAWGNLLLLPGRVWQTRGNLLLLLSSA